MPFVRARQPQVITHPETGSLITISPSKPVRDDDPIVKANPWLFLSDDELEIERGTRRPGERRMTRRRRSKVEDEAPAEPSQPAGPITSDSPLNDDE